jgi:hypothetical protein
MGELDEPASGDVASSPDLARSRLTAMSSAVLREVKGKLDSVVIRLEAVEKDRRQPAITRAVNLLLQAEHELANVDDGPVAASRLEDSLPEPCHGPEPSSPQD